MVLAYVIIGIEFGCTQGIIREINNEEEGM